MILRHCAGSLGRSVWLPSQRVTSFVRPKSMSFGVIVPVSIMTAAARARVTPARPHARSRREGARAATALEESSGGAGVRGVTIHTAMPLRVVLPLLAGAERRCCPDQLAQRAPTVKSRCARASVGATGSVA
jgi:hypothetical protein